MNISFYVRYEQTNWKCSPGHLRTSPPKQFQEPFQQISERKTTFLHSGKNELKRTWPFCLAPSHTEQLRALIGRIAWTEIKLGRDEMVSRATVTSFALRENWQPCAAADNWKQKRTKTNFSLAASFWGICLLSAFILLRWLKLANISIFHSYKPERWRQVNQSQIVSQGN